MPIPRRKIAAAALAVLLLAWGGTALGIHFIAERRWTAMKADWQALLEEARLRGRARPPLRGDPLDGNAWEDYGKALAEVRSLYELESQAAPRFLREAPGSNRALVERVLARHPSMIEAVRRASRRARVNLDLEWKEGALTLPSRYGSATIVPLAVCLSRFSAEAGRTGEAAELLVDTCRFAADIDHVEDMAPGLDELRELICGGKLGREDLAKLDRELEQLDREFPRRGHRAFLELVALGAQFLKSGRSITVQLVGLHADPEDQLWRYGFSAHLMKAEAFDLIRGAVQRLHDADERTWAESRDLLKGLGAELAASRNPIVQTAPEEVLASDLAHRTQRARLRLLRLAARYKATGDLDDFDDPFGGKLQARRSEEALKAWSVGPEGSDHGGIGGFLLERDDRDIVIDVRR
jgi:hypothetical protein